MSISGTMSSALSGLNAAARSAELISSNIANALTEGYGRRELQVTALRVGNSGQGVQVTSVSREINQALVADRRIADADASNMNRQADFLARLEAMLGSPENGSSLSGRFAAFDSALIAAAGEPENSIRQDNVAEAARALTGSFQAISKDIQAARSEADKRIASDVDEVNRTLVAISNLNKNIATFSGGGRDHSSLLDQRQQLIDHIATIIPIREVPRENGRVALFTTGGAVLLEGKPAKLDFVSVGIITEDMTLGSGALSGLTINGRAINTGPMGPLAGGSLAADFAIRDALAPVAQGELDAVARDLILRFQDMTLDPTLTATDAGLFTDGNLAFSPSNEHGIAGRIGLNAAVDTDLGGAPWRLRDGLGATSPGPVGQSALFIAMQSALNDPRATASGQYVGSSRGAMTLAGEMVSYVSNQRLAFETEADFAAARATALQGLELAGGVDTDRELSDLLLVEQAYAANAKVIQTTDDLIQILLGM